MEYSQPLGWISRSADGKFVLRGSADDEEGGFIRTAPTATHSLIPSNHAGARGSIRSDGSGQSSHPVHLSPSMPSCGPYATPSRFHTSSPGLGGSFFAEDISSVRQPSSVERSFPSTVSSHFTPPFPMHFRPIHRAQDAPPSWMLHQQVFGSPVQPSWHQGGWPGSRRWLPIQAYSANTNVPRFHPVRPCVPRGFNSSVNPHKQISPTYQRPLATSSPPRLEGCESNGVSHVPSGPDSSESDSSDAQVTYTRDRLLGAVERVRSAAFHRQQHLPSAELLTDADGSLAINQRLATPSRTSVTSGSSGHGSKAASLAHSSLQGELDMNNRSGSSSGFASRNHSAAFASSSFTPNGVHTISHLSAGLMFEADSPHSEPAMPVVDGFSHLQNKTPNSHHTRDGWNDRGLSDSELCGVIYPTGLRKYENTEARCAALKEEFLRFRRKQRERQCSVELESTC